MSVRAAALGCCTASLMLPVAWGQTNGSSFTAFDALAPMLELSLFAPRVECSELAGQALPDIEIVSTEQENDLLTGAGFCTVRAVHSGRIDFVVNLPLEWNGRLYIHGNGGYAGESIFGEYGRVTRLKALRFGFATAFTNLGHNGADFEGASWAFNNREAEIDFSYRGLHLATGAAKSLINAFYGEQTRFSYFEGCSTGGGQGLKAAQRFPADFDGIAVGAPVFDFVGLQLYGWNNQVAIAGTPFSDEKVAKLGELVMAQHDANDGLADGVINNPNKVRNIELGQITALNNYFTGDEETSLSRIYGGVVIKGKQMYPGVPVGAEPMGQKYQSGSFEEAAPASGWATRLIADESGYQQQRGNVETWLKYMAFEEDDPDADIFSIDLERDMDRFDFMARIMDVTSADYSAFRDRGGRVLIYHGWADTGVNPLMTVDYYERVLEEMGGGTTEFFRTFMVPGMFHCRGGLGVDRFDVITPVIAWTELGMAPATINAARIGNDKVVRTLPLCPWPAVARYTGKGDSADAINFECLSD